MNKNKILTAIMAGTMIMGSAMPVFAATTETQGVGEEEATAGTTRETDVLYSQSSTFSVTIPKTIVLDGATKDSDYTVNVKGDISSDKQVSVAPQDAIDTVDGTNFYMKDVSAVANKKADVEATVTQDATVWSSGEVCVASTGTTKNGNVSAQSISAGSWKGTFTFNIALQDA